MVVFCGGEGPTKSRFALSGASIYKCQAFAGSTFHNPYKTALRSHQLPWLAPRSGSDRRSRHRPVRNRSIAICGDTPLSFCGTLVGHFSATIHIVNIDRHKMKIH